MIQKWPQNSVDDKRLGKHRHLLVYKWHNSPNSGSDLHSAVLKSDVNIKKTIKSFILESWDTTGAISYDFSTPVHAFVIDEQLFIDFR